MHVMKVSKAAVTDTIIGLAMHPIERGDSHQCITILISFGADQQGR
jgi:hypothetical protein